MSDPLTMEREAEIRARLAAATPGPWRLSSYSLSVCDETHVLADCYSDDQGHDFKNGPANAAFLANSPADLAALLAEVDRLRAPVALVADRREVRNAQNGDPTAMERLARATNPADFAELRRHIGHQIACVSYTGEAGINLMTVLGNPWAMALECETCDCTVLLASLREPQATPAPALIFGHDGTTGGNDDPA